MGVLTAILAVFTSIGQWFSTAFNNIIPIFWTAGEGSRRFVDVYGRSCGRPCVLGCILADWYCTAVP